jgi:hypothetical protein
MPTVAVDSDDLPNGEAGETGVSGRELDWTRLPSAPKPLLAGVSVKYNAALGLERRNEMVIYDWMFHMNESQM